MTASDSIAADPERLTAELERLRPGLRIIALRALADPDAADDAVQETLARAVVAIEQGRLADRSKLAAYVAGIARHVCSHVIRDRKDTVPLDGVDTGGQPIASDQAPDALDSLISAGELERLRAAFTTLPAHDQRLLRLCFHEHQSPAEAAKTLAEPAERVRKQKSRALEKLRRAFLGDGHEHPSSGTSTVTPIATGTRKSRPE